MQTALLLRNAGGWHSSSETRSHCFFLHSSLVMMVSNATRNLWSLQAWHNQYNKFHINIPTNNIKYSLCKGKENMSLFYWSCNKCNWKLCLAFDNYTTSFLPEFVVRYFNYYLLLCPTFTATYSYKFV